MMKECGRDLLAPLGKVRFAEQTSPCEGEWTTDDYGFESSDEAQMERELPKASASIDNA
jgi:hypothetical protein